MIDQLYSLLLKYDSEDHQYHQLFQEIQIGAKVKLLEDGNKLSHPEKKRVTFIF